MIGDQSTGPGADLRSWFRPADASYLSVGDPAGRRQGSVALVHGSLNASAMNSDIKRRQTGTRRQKATFACSTG